MQEPLEGLMVESDKSAVSSTNAASSFVTVSKWCFAVSKGVVFCSRPENCEVT